MIINRKTWLLKTMGQLGLVFLPRGKKRMLLIFLLILVCLGSYTLLPKKRQKVKLPKLKAEAETKTITAPNQDPSLHNEYELENMLTILSYEDEPEMVHKKKALPRSDPGTSSPTSIPGIPLKKFIPNSRLVHMDFKGAPPKLAYLKQLIPLLPHLGATGLLLEYEDMFPYEGPLSDFSSSSAYRLEEIQQLVQLARANRLEVIPLLQTFGHMEFALKLPERKHLRESRMYPQTICPTNNQTLPTLVSMIDQMVAAHPGITRLHLGCDEVYHLGRCPACLSRATREGPSYTSGQSFLFLDHVRRVTDYVRRKHGVQPLVWDDMFRTIPNEDIVRSGLNGGVIEPVVWSYGGMVPQEVWQKYSFVFPNIWGAGSYKGTTGETVWATDVSRHVRNTGEWLATLGAFQKGGDFRNLRGFVLTGWQRYDHFSVLCDLLPSAVPSLAVNMLMVAHGDSHDDVIMNASVVLACSETTPMANLTFDPYLWGFVTCNFPGTQAFRLMKSLKRIRETGSELIRKLTRTDGWFNAFSLRHNMTNTLRVKVEQKKVEMVLRTVRAVKKHALVALTNYYEKDVISEWIDQQIQPLLNVLTFIDAKIKVLVKIDTWPKRP